MHTYTDTEMDMKYAYLYRYRKNVEKRKEKYFKLCTPIFARKCIKKVYIFICSGRQANQGAAAGCGHKKRVHTFYSVHLWL